MNKLALFTSLTAFSLVSGIAAAATLKNTDKDEVSVQTDIAGKVETVKIKSGESFDSKGKDVTFTLGKETPVTAKADEHLVISGGKIEAAKSETPEAKKSATDAPAMEAKPVEAVKTEGHADHTVKKQ